MQVRFIWIVITLMGMSVCASAQWLNYPTSGAPRTKDGKPVLSAPAPRRGGKPDLSGRLASGEFVAQRIVALPASGRRERFG